ncbi:MAG: hypothetical protein KDB80_13765 [Planctomycetes bacterium]|nr:hypothetical protein [Planctomycetota bacterium]
MTDPSTVQRIERLEAAVRRASLGNAILGALLLVVVLVAATSTSVRDSADVVRAKRLEIVDAHDEVVVLAAANADGSGYVSVKTLDGSSAALGAPTPSVSAADLAMAKQHFQALCVTCHGRSGQGDGPAAAALNPKPRDWTDAKWQAERTDAKLAEVILGGGAAVGLSPLMPASPQFRNRPGVVTALVQIVRDSAKPK